MRALALLLGAVGVAAFDQDVCHLRYYHRQLSQPDIGLRASACPQYEDNACCLPSTVKSAETILDAYGGDYHWDRCATYPNAEVQTVTVIADGGTWKLTFNGQDTTPLAASASAAQVQKALVALSNVGAGGLIVASPGIVNYVDTTPGVYTVTFIGTGAGLDADVSDLLTASIDLTGTPTRSVVETTKGVAGSPYTYTYKKADGVKPYTAMSETCAAYFVAEACLYECDPEAGQFRKFAPAAIYDPSVHFAGDGQAGSNKWSLHGMPISGEFNNAWYDACKDDYWTAGSSGNWFYVDGAGARAASGCGKFSEVFGSGKNMIERMFDSAFVHVGTNTTNSDLGGEAMHDYEHTTTNGHTGGYTMMFSGGILNKEVTNTRYGRVGSSATPPVPGAVTTLRGSGTTNPSKFIWHAMDQFESRAQSPLAMTYRAVGSSTGQKEFVGGTPAGAGGPALNHFGAGDIPMSAARYAALTSKGRSVTHIPFAAGGIAIFHSVPASTLPAGTNLVLDACTLAKIFSHTIKTWDNQYIMALNPTLKVPAGSPIKVAHRTLGSSSTDGFTSYLAVACPASWTLGRGSTITWPATTTAVEGSDGMGAAISGAPFTIGYLDAGHGHKLNLEEVALKNKDGNPLTSKTASLSATVATGLAASIIPTTATSDWSAVNLYNLGGATAWPITMLTYFYVETNHKHKYPAGAAGLEHPPMTSSLLKAFVEWTLSTEGQASLADFSFIGLPETLLAYNRASLAAMVMPTVGYRPFVFETSTQVGVGAGINVISGKISSYASFDRTQLRAELATESVTLSKEISSQAKAVENIESSAMGLATAGFVLVLLLAGCTGLTMLVGLTGVVIGIKTAKEKRAKGVMISSNMYEGKVEMTKQRSTE